MSMSWRAHPLDHPSVVLMLPVAASFADVTGSVNSGGETATWQWCAGAERKKPSKTTLHLCACQTMHPPTRPSDSRLNPPIWKLIFLSPSFRFHVSQETVSLRD